MSRWRHPERLVHPGRILLGAVVLVGAGVAVAAAAGVGPVPAWIVLSVALLAVWSAVRPDSLVGLVLVLAIAQAWLVQRPGTVTSAWALLAVAGVVAVHVGLLLAAQGPRTMRPDPVQVALWMRRAAGLWLAGASVWLAGHLLDGVRAPSSVLIGVLVLLLAATFWTLGRLTAKSPTT